MTTTQPLPEPDETGADPASKAPDAAPDAIPDRDAAALEAATGSPAAASAGSPGPAQPAPTPPADAAVPGAEAGDIDQAGTAASGSADATPHLHLHSLGRDLLTGLGFFTRLPVPATSGSLAEAAHVFAPIGALIGCVATLVYVLGLSIGLSAVMSAVLVIAATALLTGALHEDGLADFADMLGVRGDRARKLAVMRDSTIGSYGTLALIFVSLMKVAAIYELAVPGQVAGALISAHALGRGVLPLIMRSFPMARSDGLAVHAGKPPAQGSYLGLGLAIIIVALVSGPAAAFVATVSALVTAFLIALIARRQLGGYTGDVLGAAEQIVEIAVIMNFVSFT